MQEAITRSQDSKASLMSPSEVLKCYNQMAGEGTPTPTGSSIHNMQGGVKPQQNGGSNPATPTHPTAVQAEAPGSTAQPAAPPQPTLNTVTSGGPAGPDTPAQHARAAMPASAFSHGAGVTAQGAPLPGQVVTGAPVPHQDNHQQQQQQQAMNGRLQLPTPVALGPGPPQAIPGVIPGHAGSHLTSFGSFMERNNTGSQLGPEAAAAVAAAAAQAGLTGGPMGSPISTANRTNSFAAAAPFSQPSSGADRRAPSPTFPMPPSAAASTPQMAQQEAVANGRPGSGLAFPVGNAPSPFASAAGGQQWATLMQQMMLEKGQQVPAGLAAAAGMPQQAPVAQLPQAQQQQQQARSAYELQQQAARELQAQLNAAPAAAPGGGLPVSTVFQAGATTPFVVASLPQPAPRSSTPGAHGTVTTSAGAGAGAPPTQPQQQQQQQQGPVAVAFAPPSQPQQQQAAVRPLMLSSSAPGWGFAATSSTPNGLMGAPSSTTSIPGHPSATPSPAPAIRQTPQPAATAPAPAAGIPSQAGLAQAAVSPTRQPMMQVGGLAQATPAYPASLMGYSLPSPYLYPPGMMPGMMPLGMPAGGMPMMVQGLPAAAGNTPSPRLSSEQQQQAAGVAQHAAALPPGMTVLPPTATQARNVTVSAGASWAAEPTTTAEGVGESSGMTAGSERDLTQPRAPPGLEPQPSAHSQEQPGRLSSGGAAPPTQQSTVPVVSATRTSSDMGLAAARPSAAGATMAQGVPGYMMMPYGAQAFGAARAAAGPIRAVGVMAPGAPPGLTPIRPYPGFATAPGMGTPVSPQALAFSGSPTGYYMHFAPQGAGLTGQPVLPQLQLQQPVQQPVQQQPQYLMTTPEPSEEEEDAAAALQAMHDGRVGGTGAPVTSPTRKARTPRDGSATGQASGGAPKRRSLPGGPAAWAEHAATIEPRPMADFPAELPRSDKQAQVQPMSLPVRPSHRPHRPAGPSPLGAPAAAAGVGVGEGGGLQAMEGVEGAEGLMVGGLASLPSSEIAWLEELTTTERFFKVCQYCGGGLRAGERPTNGGRDALATLLDLDEPSEEGVCANCRAERAAKGHRLLQIRRSTYHDVVKTSDLAALNIDLSGVQVYSINNARVVFLRPRPASKPPKGSTMPSRCVLDGRQLMDAPSKYCSLRCKMDVELHNVPPLMTSNPLDDTPGSVPAAAAPRTTTTTLSPAAKRARTSRSGGGPATTGGTTQPLGGVGVGDEQPKTPRSGRTASQRSAPPLRPLKVPPGEGIGGEDGEAATPTPTSRAFGAGRAMLKEQAGGDGAGTPKTRGTGGALTLQQQLGQKRAREEGVEGHLLYKGDHGALHTIEEGRTGAGDTTEATDMAVQVEGEVYGITHRVGHLPAAGGDAEGGHDSEEEAARSGPRGTPTPPRDGPLGAATATTGAAAGAAADMALPHRGLHVRPRPSPPHAHHVSFGGAHHHVLPTHVSTGGDVTPTGSGRTGDSALLSAHGGDGSDSYSTGSHKRKPTRVQRANLE